MTVDDLLAALAASDFDALVGVSEDGSVDFKSQPYILDREDQKYELAKDVASFAGAMGPSVIVFPVETETRDDSLFERVVRARPIALERVNVRQIRDVVESHVFPSVQGLDIRTYPRADDPNKHLVAIVIPAQPESNKPFLVLSPVGSTGTKIQGWLIGIPTRGGDSTDHIRPGELHELLLRGSTLGARVDELAAMLAQLSASSVVETAADEPSAERVATEARRYETSLPTTRLGERAREAAQRFATDRVEKAYTWEGEQPVLAPALVLAAAPSARVSVPTLFREAGVREALEHPPLTRPEGWNLATLSRAELVEGSRLEVRNGRRKLLSLADDGSFITVARMLDFLARDRVSPADSAEREPIYKVNSLALVEYTHDFVLTFQTLATYFDPHPEEARFLVAIYAATGPVGSIFLPPYGIDAWGWRIPEHFALPDQPDYEWSYGTAVDVEPGKIAYHLLEHVYAYFKQTAETIPYLNEERSAVDSSLFSRAQG